MDKESAKFDSFPDAQPLSTRGFSMVWLVPIITGLVGIWLIFKTYIEKGTEIEISFKNGYSLEAGKTLIKYKDVSVGLVHTIIFSDDYSEVILKATINREVASLLKEDTRFWIVKPQLTIREISNVSTLVSGVYIALEPGKGEPTKRFSGLETPPPITADQQGKQISLITDELGSLDYGSPIYYKGILAGKVLGYEVIDAQKKILVHGFVETPYSETIGKNTRFWNVSGFDLVADADGLTLRSESLQSFFLGGVSFDNTTDIDPSSNINDDATFTLYENRESALERVFSMSIPFVFYFEEPVRGLIVGAPVELFGVKIGRVLDIRLEYIVETRRFQSRVLAGVDPERIHIVGDREWTEVWIRKEIQNLVDQGLRASLSVGSYLTGQLFISLENSPQEPIRIISEQKDYPEIPTVLSSLYYLEESFKRVLFKIDKVSIDRIGHEILRVVEGMNTFVHNPDLPIMVSEFKESLQNLRKILQSFEGKSDLLSGNLTDTLSAGKLAFEQLQKMMDSLDQLLQPNSQFQHPLNQLTTELAEMMRSMRILIEMVERHPNAVIFGKPESK